MTTKLTLFNGALSILKHTRLTAVDNDVPEQYLLNEEYDKCLQSMLEEGDWNFASRSVAIEAANDVTSEFGPSNAFEIPDDYCRLISIGANGDQWPQLEFYKIEGNYILASTDLIYITYVSNGTSYGLNLARWPQTFVRAVEFDLAQRVAPHVTSMGAAELQALREDAKERLQNARTKDARAQSSQIPPPGNLVMSRLGRGAIGYTTRWRP